MCYNPASSGIFFIQEARMLERLKGFYLRSAGVPFLLLHLFFALCFWSAVSYAMYPTLSENLCILDPTLKSEYIEEIKQVASEFRHQGVNMKLNCSFSSIRIFMAPLPEIRVLAETEAHHLGIQNGTFSVPFITLSPRTIVFNKNVEPHFDYDREMFQMVLIHEIGHALGSPHISDSKNIMYPYIVSMDTAEAISQVISATDWLNRYSSK
jgi:hypothetical protein